MRRWPGPVSRARKATTRGVTFGPGGVCPDCRSLAGGFRRNGAGWRMDGCSSHAHRNRERRSVDTVGPGGGMEPGEVGGRRRRDPGRPPGSGHTGRFRGLIDADRHRGGGRGAAGVTAGPQPGSWCRATSPHPWSSSAALDAALESVRTFSLTSQLGWPSRPGIVKETPFVGPGVRHGPVLEYLPVRLSLVPRLFDILRPVDAVLIHPRCPETARCPSGSRSISFLPPSNGPGPEAVWS